MPSTRIASGMGATSQVLTVAPGIVEKKAWDFQPGLFRDDAEHSFMVEEKILEHLGQHPRVVKYLGRVPGSLALRLGRASHGDLQDYLDDNPDIPEGQRTKWCREAAEAVVFVHGRGVLHSDLRPGNFLVDVVGDGSLELRLCDFGGSVCERLGVDGKALPSIPFYDPALGVETTPTLDIFGLGSVMYTILTGRWPFRDVPGRPSSSGERKEYETLVEGRLCRNEFPCMSGMREKDVIVKCWTQRYESVQQVLDDLVALELNES